MAGASCVNDTLKEINVGSAIDFRVAAMTRATEATTSNIDAFYVTALIPGAQDNYFTDVPYMKASGDIFISSEPYYWPASNELQFYAYSPSLDSFSSDAQLSIGAGSQKVTGFETASSFEEQKDFIVATKQATKDANLAGVELQFEHKLSQIEVYAKNSNSAYVYNIRGVRLGGMASKGEFNFAPRESESEWTIDPLSDDMDISQVYGMSKELSELSTCVMGSGGNAMLIPQQLTPWDPTTGEGAFIAVYAQVKTAEGAQVYPRPGSLSYDNYAWLIVPIDTKWEAGYRYIYTLDFSQGAGYNELGIKVLGDRIQFSVDEIRWNHTTSVQSTAADFIGTWDLVKCESWREYEIGHDYDDQYIKDWPPYALYESDEDLSFNNKVSQEMRRTRVVAEDMIHIYPGVDGWEVPFGFKIQDGYLYITAEFYGVVQENRYLIIDYSKDSFTIYFGEPKGGYFMEKIFYYKKVSDNNPGTISGKWKLVRGTGFSGTYHPINNTLPRSRVDISSLDDRLHCLEVDEQTNMVKFISAGDDSVELYGDGFTLGMESYYFRDITTSTMMLKYYPDEYNTSYVEYLFYERIN